MVELKHLQAETLLSREQLKELDGFQARFTGLEREMAGLVDEFQNILNRHYFNRENSYLDEQQQNLREVVQLQSRLEKLAGSIATRSTELKTFMMGLQQALHGLPPKENAPPAVPNEPDEPAAVVEKTGPGSTREPKIPTVEKAAPVVDTQSGKAFVTSNVLSRSREGLADVNKSGGEISLKVMFEELKLAEPRNSEIVNEISKSLRKLLYDRQLVGYSKTSLVFGKGTTLESLLETLKPIFLTESMQLLLLEKKLVEAGEREKITLACNQNRELVYLLFD